MSVYIKDMDMPVDCLACRINCKNEHYLEDGRPFDCPLEEAKDGDLISRANAIEAIQNAYCKPCKERGDDHNEVRCRACDYDNAIIQIDALPSAETVQGEWIYKTNDESVCEEWECSECGNWNFEKTDFCPNCGARMFREDGEA